MLTYKDLGSGTPIVLLHGLGSTKEAWVSQHELANKYRLIIPDLRGHGETVINENFTIKNFALDIIELIEHLNIPSAFICGFSFGGIVAQELYKQRPDLVKGLILSNTTSYIPPFFASNMINMSQQDLIEHILSTGLYDESFKEEARKTFRIRDTYMESMKASIGVNYFSVLMTIKKPVLLIGSTHDKVTPSLNLYLMKTFIRRAQIAILKDTGHLSNIEKRDLFNQHIKDFIATIA
jgi:3-oxoadipate enol-lactonase